MDTYHRIPTGVTFTPTETRREVVVAVAIEAERLGYDAFFVTEGWAHDAVVLLGEIAARTSRITIGSGVLNVWSRSAGLLAMAAASLAEASGGRFVLGLGTSSPQLVEGLHDHPFHGSTRRLRHVLGQTRTLLDGGRIDLSTPTHERALRLGIQPSARIPIYVAGLGPATIRLAGELADGWYPFLYPIERVPLARSTLARGHNRGRIEPMAICPVVPAFVDPDPERAAAAALEFVEFYLARMGSQYRTSLTRLGRGNAVADAVAGNRTSGLAGLTDSLTVHGGPDRANVRLRAWSRAGASMPVLALPSGASVEQHVATLEALRPAQRTELLDAS